MTNTEISGLTESDIERIRRLKGLLQAEAVQMTMTNKDAVMWAVNNELEKRE
jgi:hypothetical protein